MEIYIKNENGQLEETTLNKILGVSFKKVGFKTENGSFKGENHNWLGIVQESKKPSEVIVNITFEDNGNTITGLHVYESPIKRVVDSDNCRQFI